MYTIDLEFQRVETVPATTRYSMTGVFVLWSPANLSNRPTYLGDDPLLQCPRDEPWLWADLTGVVAQTRSRRDAETAEAALLWTSAVINRRPVHSICDDRWKHIHRLIARHPTLCIDIRGQRPFVRPDAAGERGAVDLRLWFDASIIGHDVRPPQALRCA